MFKIKSFFFGLETLNYSHGTFVIFIIVLKFLIAFRNLFITIPATFTNIKYFFGIYVIPFIYIEHLFYLRLSIFLFISRFLLTGI